MRRSFKSNHGKRSGSPDKPLSERLTGYLRDHNPPPRESGTAATSRFTGGSTRLTPGFPPKPAIPCRFGRSRRLSRPSSFPPHYPQPDSPCLNEKNRTRRPGLSIIVKLNSVRTTENKYSQPTDNRSENQHPEDPESRDRLAKFHRSAVGHTDGIGIGDRRT